MSCLCPRNKAAVLWRVAYCCWPMIHHRCVLLCHERLLDEVALRSFIQINVQADLEHVNSDQRVIWSTEPAWNMCIIWYFSSFISSNKQFSNETLVCAVIQTSDPSGPCHFPVPCPELLGLGHALPCRKDFLWVVIATTSTSNTVLAYNMISYGARAEIQTRVRRVLSNRSTIWAINRWYYSYYINFIIFVLKHEKTNKCRKNENLRRKNNKYWHIFWLKFT
jgi:hypothetical protein